MNEDNKTNWLQSLQDKINMLAERFGLDEIQTHALRDFVIGIARDQFKIGSRSGAGWAFKKAREEKMVNAG